MAVFTLNIFDLAQIATDDPDGFANNGGYQFTWGVSTVTIAPGAVAQPVAVNDSADGFFDVDAGPGQALVADTVIDGAPYAAGTGVEAEYVIVVQDSSGARYDLQMVSVGADAYNIAGFVIQGAVPPFGDALTVVQTFDMRNGVYSYPSSAAPPCFGAQVRIATAGRGWVPAGRLLPGDRLCDAEGRAVRLELVLRAARASANTPRPVRIRPGALGPGLPLRDLWLSPQHRVFHAALGALVPARALTGLRGISEVRCPVAYVHLVTRAHCLLLAEAVACESFWPGGWAMAGLPPNIRRRVRQIMGRRVTPAARLLDKRARASYCHACRVAGNRL